MSGRTVSSGGAKEERHTPRSVESGQKGSVARSSVTGRARKTRKARSVASHPEIVDELQPQEVTRAIGQEGAFVDARELHSEDYVAETLHQTTGALGVISRPKVVDFTQRAKERKRASLRVIALRVVAVVAVLAALTGLVWLLFFSSVFRLETNAISVSGANEWVSEQTIRSIADKQAGKSLFLVSTNEVSKQLKDIPGVSEANISKKFPKSMNVEVKAQRPAAMLKSGDTLTAVDAQARVLNSVTNANVDGIPVIEVKDIDKSLKNRSVKEALTILGALPESMRTSITKVTAATQDSITTTLNDGERIIVWGDSSQLKLKMAVVDKIINDPNVIGDRQQVDVSAPLKPIMK